MLGNILMGMSIMISASLTATEIVIKQSICIDVHVFEAKSRTRVYDMDYNGCVGVYGWSGLNEVERFFFCKMHKRAVKKVQPHPTKIEEDENKHTKNKNTN